MVVNTAIGMVFKTGKISFTVLRDGFIRANDIARILEPMAEAITACPSFRIHPQFRRIDFRRPETFQYVHAGHFLHFGYLLREHRTVFRHK